jgi:hypothetical protein
VKIKKNETPWNFAKRSGNVIITPIVGPMVGVYYPYRKTGDLYVALDGKPIKCCQEGCEEEFPIEEFKKHIQKHDRRTRQTVLKSLAVKGEG